MTGIGEILAERRSVSPGKRQKECASVPLQVLRQDLDDNGLNVVSDTMLPVVREEATACKASDVREMVKAMPCRAGHCAG
jgi:hypothetical protein